MGFLQSVFSLSIHSGHVYGNAVYTQWACIRQCSVLYTKWVCLCYTVACVLQCKMQDIDHDEGVSSWAKLTLLRSKAM